VKKSAFTLLELVFVIVIISIMTVVMMPKTNDEPARDAANQLKRHLQYAQHLAMVNDVFDDTDASWVSNKWSVHIEGTKYSVRRSTDGTTGNYIYALDPASKKQLSTSTNITDLGDNFTISAISSSCGNIIMFDNLGRPYAFSTFSTDTDVKAGRLTTDCLISLTGDGTNSLFTIKKETGYIGDVNAS